MASGAGPAGPFRYPNFSWYFTGQVLSNTGVWFQNLALQLVVLGATGSAQALSGITIAQFLPIFLLGIPAGRLLDRVAPRTVLLVTSLASAVVTASLFFVVTRDPDLWLLYAMVGVLGSVQAFERVAAQTIIFELVGPDGLSRAASISTFHWPLPGRWARLWPDSLSRGSDPARASLLTPPPTCWCSRRGCGSVRTSFTGGRPRPSNTRIYKASKPWGSGVGNLPAQPGREHPAGGQRGDLAPGHELRIGAHLHREPLLRR